MAVGFDSKYIYRGKDIPHTPSCSIILPVRLIILPLGPTQQKSRLRHANTMPPHQNAHYKEAAAFGGGLFVVWIKM